MHLLACYLNIAIHLFVLPALYQTEAALPKCAAITELRYNPFKDKKQSVFICLTLKKLYAPTPNQKFPTGRHLSN